MILNETNVKVGDILIFKDGDTREYTVERVSNRGIILASYGGTDTWEYINKTFTLKNMNTIKVGDKFIAKIHDFMGDGYVRTVKSIEGNKLTWCTGGWDYISEIPRHYETVNNKKIVGYETVVDLPGIPKGSKSYNKQENGNYHFPHNAFDSHQLEDTKFFKPIYQEEKIELKLSKYTATLSKDHGLVFTDGETMNFSNTRALLSKIRAAESTVNDHFSHKIIIAREVVNVNVGCKSFNANDIKLVYAAIVKLDGTK